MAKKQKFLSIPNVIVANDIPAGSEAPKGIIYKIREKVSNFKNYIEPIYYRDGDSKAADILVNWETDLSLKGEDIYFQIKFEHGYVYPTHYSIRGDDGSGPFAKEWYLYGFNEADETETLLSVNKSEGSTFCSTDVNCENPDWGTFSIDPVRKAFKYFRMKPKTSSSPSTGNYLLLAGFDIFGIYSIDGRTKAFMNCITFCRSSNIRSCMFIVVLVV